MPPRRQTAGKRGRFNRTFEEALRILTEGKKVHIAFEGQADDWYTIRTYWYDWRKLQLLALRGQEDEAAQQTRGLLSEVTCRLGSDEHGRLVVVLEPRFGGALTQYTAPAAVQPPAVGERLGTSYGASIPQPTVEENDRFTEHNLPWRQWFTARTDMEGMLACLGTLPAHLLADPALPTLDDLPMPDSAEAAALKASFIEFLSRRDREGLIPYAGEKRG